MQNSTQVKDTSCVQASRNVVPGPRKGFDLLQIVASIVTMRVNFILEPGCGYSSVVAYFNICSALYRIES